MVLPCSLWLLSVCLLSWCCDAVLPVALDTESESVPKPPVLKIAIEITGIVVSMKNSNETPKSGTYGQSLQDGKNKMKDVEKEVLDACSQLCQSLARNPKLQHGYIVRAHFKEHQLLCCS
ncbi:palmitoyl-protein thioesterase 1-like [Mus caroli]|uniref:Palmitoyl-protein thioesterase 1-like n=1 Tax=Mus caroli TaxID=10089 RepID=A0A6P5P5L1_MUSCR|nr:palmitoyl-protein thioesterase 1-like [Mus caroli]